MNLRVSALSDVGRVRAGNEDSLLVRPRKGLFAVADGMGGHVAGEVASALAVETLDRAVPEAADQPVQLLAERLASAVRDANARILEQGRDQPDTRGMGTTLTAVAFPGAHAGSCALAHVGDSRVYRYRADRLELLTRDHTWVQEQVDAGRMNPDEARQHPYANVLSRVLGLPELEVETAVIEVAGGDTLLLCTDGLTAMLDEGAIAAVLATHPDLDDAARNLIDRANDLGGVDNVTVLLLRAEPSSE